LLQPLASEPGSAAATRQRFSVTQLINYERCPRQYYFDRVMHTPTQDALAVWNDAEAPEPPANLTATLKGAVIHRFCEKYSSGDNAEELLYESFEDVLRLRQSELADRVLEINREEAISELLPLAQNYLSSAVFERVERARALSGPPALAGSAPKGSIGGFPSDLRVGAGLWSELSFRLRRRFGILSGAIDKLLITPAPAGKGFVVEIIDFKTNRLRPRKSDDSDSTSSMGPQASRLHGVEVDASLNVAKDVRAGRPRSQHGVEQIAFDFSAPPASPEKSETSLDDQVRIAASDYQLQMQAYALAVRELTPSLMQEDSTIISTLHFLEPNVEFHFGEELLVRDVCETAIDEAMMAIVSSGAPSQFPVRPATHCRMCSFLSVCQAGRDWVRSLSRPHAANVGLLKAVKAGR
jgi:CRISPR/Cas system-associated exonuclease Cas4 (RecB family)